MAEKNEIMNIMDYEVVDTRSNDIQISGTEIATQLVAVIPNAVAAPFQRYHEVEVKKEVALKTLEYRAKELEHRTMDRDKLCDESEGASVFDGAFRHRGDAQRLYPSWFGGCGG